MLLNIGAKFMRSHKDSSRSVPASTKPNLATSQQTPASLFAAQEENENGNQAIYFQLNQFTNSYQIGDDITVQVLGLKDIVKDQQGQIKDLRLALKIRIKDPNSYIISQKAGQAGYNSNETIEHDFRSAGSEDNPGPIFISISPQDIILIGDKTNKPYEIELSLSNDCYQQIKNKNQIKLIVHSDKEIFSGAYSEPHKRTQWNAYGKPDTSAYPDELSSFARTLLANRGYKPEEKLDYFMVDKPESVPGTEIPYMDKALNKILTAMQAGKKIAVYGDYDVDGTTAVSILLRTFKQLAYSDKVSFYVPQRHKEGYGFNQKAIDKLAQDYDLLLSVDLGTNSNKLIQHAQEQGLEVIVTDHHNIRLEAPKGALLVNPKALDDDKHPLYELSAAGQALKLAELLLKKFRQDDYLINLKTLAALSTVADQVNCVGENRSIVQEGLSSQAVNKGMQAIPGLKALIEEAGVHSNPILSGYHPDDVAFRLGPIINAAGRLDHAKDIVEMFSSDDEERVLKLAKEAKSNNDKRKKLEKKVVSQGFDELAWTYKPGSDKVIVLANEAWNKGVIGLAAGRIMEYLPLPVFVGFIGEDQTTFSARNPYDYLGIDITDVLAQVAQEFEELTGKELKYGGHKAAAGCSCDNKDLESFKNLVHKHFAQAIPDDYEPIQQINIEHCIGLKELVPLFNQEAKVLPFGNGFNKPYYLTMPVTAKLSGRSAKAVLENGQRPDAVQLELYEEGSIIKPFLEQINRSPELGNSSIISTHGDYSESAVMFRRGKEFLEDFLWQQNKPFMFVLRPSFSSYDQSFRFQVEDWKVYDPENLDPALYSRLEPRS